MNPLEKQFTYLEMNFLDKFLINDDCQKDPEDWKVNTSVLNDTTSKE